LRTALMCSRQFECGSSYSPAGVALIDLEALSELGKRFP
jgi:hypothetical protein